MDQAAYWIEHLQLERHPEGGYYRELYRSAEAIPQAALPSRFSGDRCFATSIVYLLESGDRSAFHRIAADETWHFYAGGALELFQLDPARPGQPLHVTLGRALHLGQRVQWTVAAGVWFGGLVSAGAAYSLLGCAVSPGFEFADFELADAAALRAQFPAAGDLIEQLT